MKKKKQKWQASVERKKALLGLTNDDIAQAVGSTEEMVKKALNSDLYPTLSEKICKHLNIKYSRG